MRIPESLQRPQPDVLLLRLRRHSPDDSDHPNRYRAHDKGACRRLQRHPRRRTGKLITIYNPLRHLQDAASAPHCGMPFPGNIVAGVDAEPHRAESARDIIPNRPRTDCHSRMSTTGSARESTQNESNQMDVKIDHNFSDKQRFTSRYSVNWGASIPAMFWDIADNFSNGDSHIAHAEFRVRLHARPKPDDNHHAALRHAAAERADTIPKSFGFDQTSLGLAFRVSDFGSQDVPDVHSGGLSGNWPGRIRPDRARRRREQLHRQRDQDLSRATI